MKKHTVQARVGQETWNWLNLQTVDKSKYVRSLIIKAKETEESRPLEDRLAETRKWLAGEETNLEAALRIAYRSFNEEKEVAGSIHAYEKSVKRLKAKLAVLEALKKS